MLPLQGKSYLITGSTDGIGRHTAQLLRQSGALVIIHGRSAHNVDETVRTLTTNGPVEAPTPIGLVADFASFADVRKLATQVSSSISSPLTALINNAGVFMTERVMSADGLEMTWQVNVASPFLLTSMLIEAGLVQQRIVNVASISAASHIDFDNTQQERGFSSHSAYSLSKLANIVFSNALAAKLRAAAKLSHITSNALDPGTVNTKMLLAGWGPIGIPVSSATDEHFVATSPELDNVSGKYFVGKRERSPPSPASNADVQQKLWNLLCQQTGARWSL